MSPLFGMSEKPASFAGRSPPATTTAEILMINNGPSFRRCRTKLVECYPMTGCQPDPDARPDRRANGGNMAGLGH